MPIQLQNNVTLLPFNTFGMNVQARTMIDVHDIEEVQEALDFAKHDQQEIFVLGGGSNILFTQAVDKIVIHNCIPGIAIIAETDDHVFVKAGSGVRWHELVEFCIHRNLQGVENLALIPGNAGAAPMQNIGAYGVELQQVFESLTAVEISSGNEVVFKKEDCKFGYRESVFKHIYKHRFIITSIILKLNKQPQFNISYGAIQEVLEASKVEKLSPEIIANAVIQIRRSKLPDPNVIGNAGSFFKNPVVPIDKFESLKATYPTISGYQQMDGNIKLAAGWLIEHSGPDDQVSWKGYRNGDAGCHAKQALVLVNHGQATGIEILSLSEQIQSSVLQKFGVVLEREVNIY